MTSLDDQGAQGTPVRVVAVSVVTTLEVVLTATRLSGGGVNYLSDFVAYWTVGGLLLDGGNPYDPGAIIELQRMLGSQFADAGVVRNRPWTLPLLIPFATLDFMAGWYAWAPSSSGFSGYQRC
jgi:hypothetical protein